MEFSKLTMSIKWFILFLIITICSYYTYYTSQPHHYMNFNSATSLLYLSSVDLGIAIISVVTSIILTAIAYNEFKKRSNKVQANEQV
jgi:predicted membrane protein